MITLYHHFFSEQSGGGTGRGVHELDRLLRSSHTRLSKQFAAKSNTRSDDRRDDSEATVHRGVLSDFLSLVQILIGRRVEKILPNLNFK